jgi:hypothetical protein
MFLESVWYSFGYMHVDLSRKDDFDVAEDTTTFDADTQRYDADEAVQTLMAELPNSSHSARL